MSNKIHKCALCKKDFSEDDLINFSLTQDDDNKEVTSYICFGCYVMMHTEIVNHERQEANAGNKNAKKHLNILNCLDKNIQTKIKAKKEDGENISLHKEINQKLINNRPEQLKKYLDKYVVGQDSAKEIMSLAIYNHYKRCLYDTEIKIGALDVSKNDNIPDELQKSNIIVTGPSGSGKTMILKTLAKKLDIPFVVVDASNLTETGYVGSDVDQCIVDLYNLANQNKAKTEYGIVFFDEFDKIATKENKIGSVKSEGVQNELLKLIEGTKVNLLKNGRGSSAVMERAAEDTSAGYIDTTNILFVCGGAFTGINDIIESRAFSNSIGFNIDTSDSQKNLDEIDECEKYNTIMDKVTPDDFISFGVIPELLGRLSTICVLHQLSKYELYDILTKPKNAVIKQYKAQYKIIDNIDINIDDKALKAIAMQAVKHKTGARGLKTIIEQNLSNVLFKAVEQAGRLNKKENKIIIRVTAENIINNTTPSVNTVSIKNK